MTALRARAWDVLVLFLVVIVLFEVLTSNQDVPLALSVPVAITMTLPLLWLRHRADAVAAITLGSWLVQGWAGDWQQEPQSELLPACLAFWALGVHLPRTRSLWCLALALLVLLVRQPDDVVVLGPLMAGIYAAGRLMRSRDQLARALQEERAHAELHAIALERVRIARELHDVVGHAVSLMTVQAGAERLVLAEERPETARVLGQIESTGRDTLVEMRRLLGVLRSADDGADLVPQPGLAQLATLVDRLRSAGLGVLLTVEGDPQGLPRAVDISAYRIVQEALTNVLRHADTGHALVRIRHAPDVVEIAVHDDGRAVPAPVGRGLAGMRERAAMLGGSLESGPSPDGGWQLVARLPREPS